MTTRANVELALGCLFAASIPLSTTHPLGNPRKGAQPGAPVLEGVEVPERMLTALEAKCGDCHSQNTRYRFYSHLAPITWMIDHDVREGRASLDMSRWQVLQDRRSNQCTHENGVGSPRRTYATTGQCFTSSPAQLSQEEQKLLNDRVKSERKRLRQARAVSSDQSFVDAMVQKP